MAKFSGVIGFSETKETSPGVWTKDVVKKHYKGDLIRNGRHFQSTEGVNDNINVSMQISIVADPYARQNCYLITYVEYLGTRWKISNIEVQYPRLILTLGGVYNG